MNAQRAKATDISAQEWSGPWRRYDILKEGVVAVIIVSVLSVLMAGLFRSPDEPSLTLKGWATSNSSNFYATTVQELAGTSESAGYGPPYNSAGTGISVGPLAPQQWFGITHPVNPAVDFVITPLQSQTQNAAIQAALKVWTSASPDQQSAWAGSYDTALTNADDDPGKVPSGNYGPVPQIAKGLTEMAAAGALDGVLMAGSNFYQTDVTKQILFLGDGSYLDDAATAAHLQGNTWGMMNETGSYPGQAWLWLYSFWYQIPQFNSDNPDDYLTNRADAIIFYVMALLSLGLVLVPVIPVLRSIPRWIPVHRLIWRDYYRRRLHPQPHPCLHSTGGRPRDALSCERAFLDRRRCSTEPRVGFVARRRRGGAAMACRSRSASRRRAASRLRSCDRYSDAVIISTPPTRCGWSRSTTRSRSVGESRARLAEVAGDQDSVTLLSVVFTP
ncbi:hypothetical protein GCM10009841_30530 [Microlunatus panaciterrae]|uniref:Uncharacterized protein n=1 Tax=Microlunatus panaciterrae TaxID=400768 RepID=A0ABS2RFE0_9ACTN|nr:hypothetical protein [Microlunatus panaciterrae]